MTPPRPIRPGRAILRWVWPQLAPPAGAAFWATLENVLLAFDPRVVMAAMHTTMIRASMTAYSTAVGPSSFFTNSTNFLATFRIGLLPVSGGWYYDARPCRSPAD